MRWGNALMLTAAHYAQRAEECRRLAKLCKRPEDWEAFLEMAQTWDMLAEQRQERSRWKTIALADRFRSVLFLSEIASKKSAKVHSRENAV